MKYLVELCLPGDTVTPLLDMTLTLKADEEPEQDISEDISKFLIARLGFCNIYFVVLHDFFNFVNIILIMIILVLKHVYKLLQYDIIFYFCIQMIIVVLTLL